MAKFKMDSTNVPEKVVTARLGASTGAWTNPDYEVGKFVKLNGDSQYDFCAAGDAIEGQIISVESATADGWNIGSVKTEGRIKVLLGGLSTTPDTGTISVGDYVVCGNVTAQGTDLTTYPKVCADVAANLAAHTFSFNTVLSSVASGTTSGPVYQFVPGFRFKILEVAFVASVKPTTADKTATLVPYVSGTAITDGALALTTTGIAQIGTVYKTTNTSLAGESSTSTLSICATGVAAFAEGSGTILVKVQNLDELAVMQKGGKKWRVVSLDGTTAVGQTATIEMVSSL